MKCQIMVNHGSRLATLICLLALAVPALAQTDRRFNLTPQLPSGLKMGAVEKEVQLTATFEQAEGTDRGRVHVKAVVAKDWHLYSVTQPAGGPKRTRLELGEGSPVKLLGPFTPNTAPQKSNPEIFQGVTVEDHVDEVIWTAPIQFADPANPASSELQIIVDAQACKDATCLPVEETLTAKFTGSYAPPMAGGEFRDENSVVSWSAELLPGKVRPGDDAQLIVRATVDDGYHLYKSSTVDANFSTVIIVTKKNVLRVGSPTASSEPVLSDQQIPGLAEIAYHEGDVTWTLPIQVDKTAEAGEYPLEVMVGYQACTDSSCLERRGIRLTAAITLGKEASDAAVPVAITSLEYREIAEAATVGNWVDDLSASVGTEGGSGFSIPLALAFGLLGGVILNLMPCVLPVIGLKVMSFVEQAGQDRGKILSLNLWYTLGLLSVFWCLAAVAIGFRTFYGESFSWGEQYTYIQFRLGLMVFVFAMALSFLGTWEIPLPGFATNSSAGALQRKEGPAGAFSKGVFSTVLATPCSGPFLGPVFGFMLTQSNVVVVAVFTAIGLGMALPYLLIGLFPSTIAWLPKPGEWMETLKQGLSFFLLGTVVYLFAGVPDEYRAAVFGMLIAVWFGCWIIGRVPNWESMQKRFTAWCTGASAAIALTLLMFHLLVPAAEIMKWESYSEAKLIALQKQGKTVMVDFTANWCPTCIYNFNSVLNTESMAEALQQHDVVPMKADWSQPSDEIKAKLSELKSASIPLLAIYPAGDPKNPIVLPDILTDSQVKAALKAATGSESVPQSASRDNGLMR